MPLITCASAFPYVVLAFQVFFRLGSVDYALAHLLSVSGWYKVSWLFVVPAWCPGLGSEGCFGVVFLFLCYGAMVHSWLRVFLQCLLHCG
jgi:hypothetical protein